MKLKTVQSFILPMLLGSGILAFMSAIQKSLLNYPLYPTSFVLPVIAGAIVGFLYHLRWQLKQKHHKKIEQYNKRLETILETVQSGIIIINAKTFIIESINPTAQLLYGYSDTELVGKYCYDFLCEHAPENCPILSQDTTVDIVEQTRINTTGLNVPIIRNSKKAEFDDQFHIIVSVMDISPLVETEEKLREANHRVRTADRLKTEFLTNVGHEIRTPLNAVIGITELLMDQNLPDETIDDLQLIKNSGKSLLKTMENIMDYAMLKSGSYVLQQQTFDIYESLIFSSELYTHKAREKGLAIHLDIESCKDIKYDGDQSVFNKIVSNLLDNAIKFTASGSVTIKTSLVSDPSLLNIQISDTGIGIPEQKQDFIFDAFYQVNGSITRDYEGTGMGLALVDFFVQQMGASMALESAEGKGSTFQFLIPV